MKRFISIIMILVVIIAISKNEVLADELGWQIEATNSSIKRDGPAVTSIGDELYIISGRGNKKVDIYNPITKEWRSGATIPTSTHAPAVSSFDNKIYVINGYGSYNLVQIYDTLSDTWSNGANMPVSKYGAMASVVNGNIYVMGGRGGSTGFMNDLAIYDISLNTWTSGVSMPIAVDRGTAVAVGKNIYVIGGLLNLSSGGITDAVQIYDTETGSWTTGTAMPTKRNDAMAVSVGENIYVIGGYTGQNGTAIKTVEVYNTITDTWSSAPALISARYSEGAVLINENIYVAGHLDTIESLQVTSVTQTSDSPSSLTATGGSSKIDLSWDSVSRAESYTIKRSLSDGGPYTVIAENVTDTSYTDTDVINDTTYYYVVTAINSGGESENSNQVRATPINVPKNYVLAVLLKPTESAQLIVSYNLSDNEALTWTSSDESVATVDAKGKVTAVAEGIAYITATNDDRSFNESIPVRIIDNAEEMRLSVYLMTGQKQKLYMVEDPQLATWQSMDQSVVTVSSSGELTAIGKGLAIVQAEIDGEIHQIYVRVNE